MTTQPTAQHDIVIRTAHKEDADRAVEITVEAFNGVSIDQAIERHCGPTATASWEQIKGQVVRDQFDLMAADCFTAWIGEEMVGYVSNDVDREIGRGCILNLAVDKNHRGKGIGRLLLEHSLAHFRKQGLKQAKIETLAVNEAGRHLYPSLGFVEVARQIHFAMNL